MFGLFKEKTPYIRDSEGFRWWNIDGEFWSEGVSPCEAGMRSTGLPAPKTPYREQDIARHYGPIEKVNF